MNNFDKVVLEKIKEVVFGDYYLKDGESKLCSIPPLTLKNKNVVYHKTVKPKEQKEIYECQPSEKIVGDNSLLKEIKSVNNNVDTSR